jgi:hypothetical protein
MRTVLVLSLTANIFLSAWASNLELAIAGQKDAVSTGATSVSTTESPAEATIPQDLSY